MDTDKPVWSQKMVDEYDDIRKVFSELYHTLRSAVEMTKDYPNLHDYLSGNVEHEKVFAKVWLAGDNYREVITIKEFKWIVRSVEAGGDGKHIYVGTSGASGLVGVTWWLIKHAYRFDTKEQAEEYTNKHFEAI